MKRLTNLLHLLTGIALLAIGACFLRGLAHDGKWLWQRQPSIVAQPSRLAKPDSAGDDPVLSAANENTKVYGVLSQPAEAAAEDAIPAQSSGPPPLVDHIGHINAVDAVAPNHFLHKRFLVKTFEFFDFEIPANATRPELEGTFQSVATEQNPDGSAFVEVLLMNDEEFSRFVNHRRVTAMLSLRPSRGGEIYWKLKAPAGNQQKYHLVFWNSSEGQRPSVVDADFTASFE